jgi:transposase
MVHDRESIERILKHQGLPWKKPSRAPPRMVQGVMGEML